MAKDVIACGIIAFCVVYGKMQMLLLKNSSTRLWEWPKGLLEAKEEKVCGLLQCAKRELLEEAGIDLDAIKHELHSPYSYEYLLSDGTKKIVYLFPAHLENRPDTRLSSEHIDWCWLDPMTLQDVELHPDKQRVLDRFLGDYLNRQEVLSQGRLKKAVLMTSIPKAVGDTEGDENSTWFWYGSWVASEQLMHPKALSDVDLVRFGTTHPSGAEVAAIHGNLTRRLNAQATLPLSVGIFYQSSQYPIFEKTPEWSYFLEANVCVSTSNSDVESVLRNCRATIEPELANEMARLVWHRLNVAERCDSTETAYQFLKGVIALNLLRHTRSSGYSFTGYTNYLRYLTSSSIADYEGTTNEYVQLLVAVDEKLGHRKLSQVTHWADIFCDGASTAISAAGQELDEMTVGYCRLCIQLIRRDNESAFLACRLLTSGTPLDCLWREIDTQCSLSPIEMRLTVLCFLAVFRVMLWPNHVAFARHKYVTMLHEWCSRFQALGCTAGVLVSQRCVAYVRDVPS